MGDYRRSSDLVRTVFIRDEGELDRDLCWRRQLAASRGRSLTPTVHLLESRANWLPDSRKRAEARVRCIERRYLLSHSGCDFTAVVNHLVGSLRVTDGVISGNLAISRL